MAWKTKAESLTRDSVYVGIEGNDLYFFRSFEDGYTIQCECDGDIVHGRDGTPVYVSPKFWTEIPDAAPKSDD